MSLNQSKCRLAPNRACPRRGSNSPVEGRPPAGAEPRRELNNCWCNCQFQHNLSKGAELWHHCVSGWMNQMLASKICENHHFILLSVRIEWNMVGGLRAIGAIMVSNCRKVTWTKEDPACNWKIANNDDEGSDVTTARELNQVPLQSTWQVTKLTLVRSAAIF